MSRVHQLSCRRGQVVAGWESQHYCCSDDDCWLFPLHQGERGQLWSIFPLPFPPFLPFTKHQLYVYCAESAGWLAHLNNNLVIISTLGIVILFLHQGETLVNYTEYNSLDNDNKIHFPRFIISRYLLWNDLSARIKLILEWKGEERSRSGLAQPCLKENHWHPVCWITITALHWTALRIESNINISLSCTNEGGREWKGPTSK